MATNHKHNTKSTHIKSDTSSKPQKSFVKKYPGFVVAVILAILVLIVFILYITSQPPAVQEQSAVAKNIFDNDQAVLDQYITNISAYSNGPFETTLEDDYYYSIMDDLNWLKKKEVEVFYSRPIEDVYIKEASFKYFMDKVVEANDYFTSGPEATNYSTIIAGAATVKPLSLNNFSDFDTAFYGSVDENTFNTIMLENDSTKAKFFTEFVDADHPNLVSVFISKKSQGP